MPNRLYRVGAQRLSATGILWKTLSLFGQRLNKIPILVKPSGSPNLTMRNALIFLLAIFVADMLLPFGIAFGNLYIACILLVMREGRRKILILTAIACFCTLLKIAVYFNGQTEYYFIVNRGTTVFALLVTATIATKLSLFQEKRRLLEELERKHKESEQFLYIASHDLNEPVRTIKIMAEMLDEKYAPQLGSEGREFTSFIHNAAERMSALIRSLLDYGRIGKGSVKQSTDLGQLVTNATDDLSGLIAESGAKITVGALPVMDVYPQELRQMFQNLISNAIKFRRPNVECQIRIEVESRGRYRRFSVRDNGMGISQEHLDKIFVMFRKLHSPNDFEGTGIGLAHCRKIAELHHGRIWAQSTLGEGSTFYFTIPNY